MVFMDDCLTTKIKLMKKARLYLQNSKGQPSMKIEPQENFPLYGIHVCDTHRPCQTI